VVKDTPEVGESGGERHARRQLLEELFYDFDHSRSQIYWTNFVRGIFFGLGSVLGGTVIVALVVWLLGQFVGFPIVGEYIRHIVTVVQHYK
jgi:hypothetical protein